MGWTRRIAAERQNEYATGEDFRKLFSAGLNSLYRLSFLLTANHEMAERCFVSGLDDCVDGNPVFREWANSWVRHVIARNAVRMIASVLDATGLAKDLNRRPEDGSHPQVSDQNDPFAGVLALNHLDRIVFVLSVLERYTDLECSTLLHSTPRKIREARTRALEHLADNSSIRIETEKSILLNPRLVAY